MINRAFYRGGGAYLVGLAIREGGDGVGLPLAFCLRHEGERGSRSMPCSSAKRICRFFSHTRVRISE